MTEPPPAFRTLSAAEKRTQRRKILLAQPALFDEPDHARELQRQRSLANVRGAGRKKFHDLVREQRLAAERTTDPQSEMTDDRKGDAMSDDLDHDEEQELSAEDEQRARDWVAEYGWGDEEQELSAEDEQRARDWVAEYGWPDDHEGETA
jgi:hypothetical protein